MKIDFRDDTKLNEEVYLDFQSFCISNKNYFTEIIDKMSYPLKENLDWWVGSTASRNIIDFPLYRDFCIILFALTMVLVYTIFKIFVKRGGAPIGAWQGHAHFSLYCNNSRTV